MGSNSDMGSHQIIQIWSCWNCTKIEVSRPV